MKHSVKFYNGCLLNYDDFQCMHPNFSFEQGRRIMAENGSDKLPKDCPLRKEPLVISIEGK